ncbi:MAG: hypothetical protein NZ959_01465, partial [Armatimonadetes bacterium]|nr:hypothetical protein [Armatimonadota bacterium]MDW8122084.1 DUF6569 family protein [Armatimonadota bacterium]
KTLFLMAGEVLLGGKQDRIVKDDTLIPPRKTVKVAVFCVEPGRWAPSESGMKFMASDALVAPQVRLKAQWDESQSAVWEETERVQRMVPGLMRRGTSYRNVLDSPGVRKAIRQKIRRLKRALASDRRTCGLIVAINGQIRWMDLFANHSLLQKSLDRLLSAAVVQEMAEGRPAISRTPRISEAQDFLKRALTGRRVATRRSNQGFVTKVESGRVVGIEMAAPIAPGAPAAAAPVHMSAYQRP